MAKQRPSEAKPRQKPVLIKGERAQKEYGTSITPKLQREFCALLVTGLPPDGVCDYLAISETAFWNWIRKGKAFINGGGKPPA